MDVVIVEHCLLKSNVDFEFLWRCISKFLRKTERWCMTHERGEYSNKNNKIVNINGIVRFRMFILVSTPLGLVTRGLSGSPRLTF